MSDLISRQDAIKAVHDDFDECCVWDESGERTADEVEAILDRVPSAVCDDCIWHVCNYNKVDWDADVVSKGLYDQVKWERDTALKTLEEHGIGFGESADRPTGRWEVVDATEPRRYGCSKCKRLSWDMSNFCPNCGCAMMEGGEEE